MLPFAKFAHNNSKNRTTQLSLFEVVCEQSPNTALNSIPILNMKKANTKAEEMIEHIKKIHETVNEHIEGNNKRYKAAVDHHHCKVIFKEGDYVGVVLTKDRFLSGEIHKMHDRKVGPCNILKKVNEIL